MPLRHIITRIGTEAVLSLIACAQHAAAAAAVIEASERHDIGAAERSTGSVHLRAAHAIDGANVHHTGEREIAEQRTRRPMQHVDVLYPTRKEHRPVVVSLGVAVHRLIDWNAVYPERDVGRVVGAEAAQRRVRREAGTLSLLVHL